MYELHLTKEDLELIELGLEQLAFKLNVTNPAYERRKELLQLVHDTLHPDDLI